MRSDENQFQQLITTCQNDPKQIQEVYENHRSGRNARFKERILHPDFREWQHDEILQKILEADKGLTTYADPRNNLALWARPPRHMRNLIHKLQQEIKWVSPNLWLVPSDQLHMTTLEIASARTASEVDNIVSSLKQNVPLQEIVDYALTHRARLVKPVISYDPSAIALSFVPAAGEAGNSAHSADDDVYTYHHLRSDLYDIVAGTGCPITARYTVSSAHMTIARFVAPNRPVDKVESAGASLLHEDASQLVQKIESINEELRSNHWPRFGRSSQCEWVVGHEKGFELVKGRSWYGKGDRILLGEGFHTNCDQIIQ